MKNLGRLTLLALLILGSSILAFPQNDDPAEVRGRVTTYYGDPLHNAEIKFFLLDKLKNEYVSSGTLIKTGLTNKSGNYEVTHLPWGEYRVTASLSGFPTAEVWRFYLGRNSERVLDFGLRIGITHGLPQLTVSGKVIATNGTTVEGATVTLTNAFDNTEPRQSASDRRGKYKFGFIQPGQYVIFVSKPGFSITSTTVFFNSINKNYPETETDKILDFRLESLVRLK